MEEEEGRTTSRRSRRTTQFREDFRFQDFSDLDSDEDMKRRASTSKSSRNRMKTCPGCDAQLSTSVKECTYCDYTFTSKSVQSSQMSAADESKLIRARFPFEPEREEDGSLKIESIFGRRVHSTDHRKHSFKRDRSGVVSATDSKYEYEYLVKFRTMSYRHVQWLTAQEIDMMNPKSKLVLTRYLNKLDNNDSTAQEDGEFDASFTEVAKILDCREETVYEVKEDKTPAVIEASSGPQSSTNGKSESSSVPSRSSTMPKQFNDDEKNDLVSTRRVNGDGEEVSVARTKIWQPLERCRRVLEKIWDDPYSSSFQQPVDTTIYDDYLDVVGTPMCLQDVLDKLNAGVYKNHQLNRFANDIRLIWNNCKIYNLYKSQIWYCAHAMSLQFERLFQAWVWSFSQGNIYIDEPIARPWESTCRVCLEDDLENEHLVMLCDHCDASYHIFCLDPPLSSVPEDAWICDHCSTWLAESGAKCLSATAEDIARQMTDTTREKTVIGVKKKKYLVKWAGLPYSECTWELAESINDDQAIAAFHKLNDTPPEEPPLTQAEIGTELSRNPKNSRLPAQIFPSFTKEVESNIYSQIRAFHFLKSNLQAPEALLKECGPTTYASTHEGMCIPMKVPADVAERIHQMNSTELQGDGVNVLVKKEDIHLESPDDDDVSNPSDSSNESNANSNCKGSSQQQTGDSDFETCNGEIDTEEIGDNEKKEEGDDVSVVEPRPQPLVWCWPTATGKNYCGEIDVDNVRVEVTNVVSDLVYSCARGKPCISSPSRPKLLDKEVEVCVGKGMDGLYMNIGSYKDRVVVLGFRRRADGRLGPAEKTNMIKMGDILVAINGLYIAHLSFSNIIKLLSSKEFPFVYLRFLRLQNNIQNALATYIEKKTMASVIPSSRPVPVQSKYFGVRQSRDTSTGEYQWICEAVDDHSLITIGSFSTELEAAVAYDNYQLARLEKQRGEDVNTPKKSESVGGELKENENSTNSQVEELVRQKSPSPKLESKRDLAKTQSRPRIRFNFTQSNAHLNGISVSEILEHGERTTDGIYLEKQVDRDNSLTKERLAALDSRNTSAMDGQKHNDLHSLDSLDSDSDKEAAEEFGVALRSGKGKEQPLPGDNGNEYPSSSESSDEWSGASESDNESDSDEDRSVRAKSKKKRNLRDAQQSSVTSVDMQECGPVARLLRAVNESTFPPIRQEWTNHVLEMGITKPNVKETYKNRRVEQIDLASGEVMHIWDSVNIASRRLNISVTQINAVLANKLDNGGGFKWRLATADSSVHEFKDEDEEDIANAKKKDKNWQEKMHKVSKEYLNGGKLRDYQVDGLNWLLRCWYTKISSILADEMGLGKTVQIVSFLDHLFEIEKIRGPFLICVPLSTIEHWRRECEGWSRMVACVYHDVKGGRDMRDIIREFEWYYKDRSRRLLKFHVLITTYDDLIKDYEELAEIPWRVVVVDEAHRLRNTNSKLLECMRVVVAKGQIAYGYQHRVLMTGTPLQNNTAELWSLLNFIEPAKFPDAEKFESRYGDMKTREQVESLQRRIAPHLLRRVKEDVAKDIPAKQETIIDVELTTMQKQYYRAIFERNHSFLMQSTRGSLPKLMNIQMELRKCCNHPYLIAGVMEKEMDSIDETMLQEAEYREEAVDWESFDSRRVTDSMIPTSGKMVLLDKLLPKLKSEGHKVLIFSQMVKMLDLIEEFCDCRKYNVERLDGRVSGNDRQKGIDRFNNNDDAFIFLLSTRAGGVGINLTAADTCIIFDSDWNPQNDIQAMARCHRIGQTKAVTIYRLITRKSFEAEMFDRASRKLGLEQALLGSRQFEGGEEDDIGNGDEKMGAKEMETLLRQGAYAVLLDEDADAVKEFCEQDIDSILDQRAHVRVVEGQQTESWLNKKKKNLRANKSMFTGATAMEHAEIDVNDPDFWMKVLPDLVTPEMMLSTLDELSQKGKDLEKDEDDEDEDDEQQNAELTAKCSKFFGDMTQMMEGIMDLQRRNTLPDRERTLCMKLLLRISLKVDLFDEMFVERAQEWLTALEGTRRRGNRDRQDLYNEAQKDNLLASPEIGGVNNRRGKKGVGTKGPKKSSAKANGVRGKRRKKLDQVDESGADPVSKPPRKRRSKARRDVAEIVDDQLQFPADEDDNIRIVFGDDSIKSPSTTKKRGRSKKSAVDGKSATKKKQVDNDETAVNTVKVKRGRRSQAREDNAAESAKSLFRERAQRSRRALVATEQNGHDIEQNDNGNSIHELGGGRNKKRREFPAAESDGDADGAEFSYEDRTTKRQRRPSLKAAEFPTDDSKTSPTNRNRRSSSRVRGRWSIPLNDDDSDVQDDVDSPDVHDPYSTTTMM